jgi:hypothetical protein
MLKHGKRVTLILRNFSTHIKMSSEVLKLLRALEIEKTDSVDLRRVKE